LADVELGAVGEDLLGEALFLAQRNESLGGKGKATELPSGIVAMGARVYNPYTGTFTQPDPIQGGGATAYGYTDGDPVNETDLSGEAVNPICEGARGAAATQACFADAQAGGPSWGTIAQVALLAVPGVDVEDAALITMDEAVDQAADHAGSDAIMETTGNGKNFQFRGTSTDSDGNLVQKISRLDVNPADNRVAAKGPHLNLETQVNGEQVSNVHIKIDPNTIRPGDHP
jgi:RHS repeat-associated protein